MGAESCTKDIKKLWGDQVTYRLIINGRLPNLNDFIRQNNKNRYAGAELKAESQKIVTVAIKQQLRGVKIRHPVSMRYRWIEKDRRRDLDNISSFGRKVIQDALVDSGVLKDDGWDYIKSFFDDFSVDPHNPRIEVEIREVMC